MKNKAINSKGLNEKQTKNKKTRKHPEHDWSSDTRGQNKLMFEHWDGTINSASVLPFQCHSFNYGRPFRLTLQHSCHGTCDSDGIPKAVQ